MKKLLLGSLLSAAVAMPGLAFAWGADGHQSVGAVADKLLEGTKAGAQVKAILGFSNRFPLRQRTNHCINRSLRDRNSGIFQPISQTRCQ